MNKKMKNNLYPYVFLLIFILAGIFIFSGFNSKVNELTYDEFMNSMTNGKIEELNIIPKKIK